MKKFNSLLTGLVLLSLSTLALAAKNPISVHVLNQQNGLPTPNVTVTLEREAGDNWVLLNTATTADNGRINALYPAEKPLKNGVYRVTFETGAWFKKNGTKTFFPKIPVIFKVDGSLSHYHIPLLLSPYGYSTYRGN
jgi:5-hydroxyisourate hydrolase